MQAQKKASRLIVFEVDLSKIKGAFVPRGLGPALLNGTWVRLPACFAEIFPSCMLWTLSC